MLFKAMTKGAGPKGDKKGTITALWSKAGAKEKEEPAPGPAAEAPEGQPEQPAADRTPGPLAKGAGAAEEAPGTAAAAATCGHEARPTGGDVAIAAVPEPSPEPAVAAAVAAANPAAAEPQADAHADQDAAVPASAPAGPSDPTPAAAGKPSAGEKKRKRGPPALEAGWSEEQLAGLQELFGRDEYASKADKTALAARIGLEVAQVNKWFDKQRKRVREETGAKRGRKSGASSSSVGKEASEPAALAPAAAEGHEGKAMATDVGQQQRQQPDGGAEAAAPEPAEAASEAAEEPMAVDSAVTPAPAAKPGSAVEAVAVPAAVPPSAAASSPACNDASPAAADAGKAPAKTPASAPQPRSLSAEEKAALIAELEAELSSLQQGGLALPLQALPSGDGSSDPAAPAERQPFSDARLAAYVVGQSAPLSQLVAALLPLFRVPDGEAAVEESVLRSRITDLAARKSHGPKDALKDGGSGMVDPQQDDAPERLWQWELRDQKHLPKELRPAAQAAKKRAARVQERVSVVSVALRLLRAHCDGKAAPKLCKALDALQKAKMLTHIEAEQQAEQEAAAAKAAAKKQAASAAKTVGPGTEDKARLKAEKEAEKERARAEKEAEKDRQKAEKEAERERARAEKEAEREKQRAEREAEKERKAKEAEDKKLAKKTGFKDAGALKKSSNMLMGFLKKATPGGAAGAAGTDASPGRPGGASQPASQPAGPAASQQTSQQGGGGGAGAATVRKPLRERTFADIFLKPEGPHVLCLAQQPSRAAEMDTAAGQPFSEQQAQSEWQQLLQAMKQRRCSAKAQPRPLGLPPAWARKSNAEELARAAVEKLKESGADLAAVRTWRRKFIWFPADSQRPPFYGSCKPSPAVGPRRFLGRDEALDYETMSDYDWQEEPEDGMSLSDAEDESEMAGGEEEEDEQDSFVCADGYLSEDEGVRVEDLDDMEVDAPEGLPEGAAAASGIDLQRLLSMQQLEARMEVSRRAGKPLVISRLPGAADDQLGAGFLQGDVSLLGALAAEVLLPGLRVGVPEDLAAQPGGGVPASAAKATSPAVGAGAASCAAKPSAGRPRAERPDDLLPELLRSVQAAPKLLKNQITDQFLEAHASRRIPKKWVHEALKEHADWKGKTSGWVLRPAALALLSGAPVALAGEPAQGATSGAEPAGAAPAGGVQPTPAATRAAPAAAGLERFFTKGAAGTPAVPSALCPDAPPSELRAPGRLVTSTAAGMGTARGEPAAAEPELPMLAVPESVNGTSDPFWRRLLQHIEAADGSHRSAPASVPAGAGEQPPQPGVQQAAARLSFEAAFEPAALARLAAGMPASILTALVTGAAAPTTPAPARAAYLRCLAEAAAALAAAEAEAAGDNLSASQQIWAPRGAPVPASLAELRLEPQLLACLTGAAEAGRGACAGSAEAQAARAAAAVATALAGSEACKAALQAGSSCADARAQLEALAAAADIPAIFMEA